MKNFLKNKIAVSGIIGLMIIAIIILIFSLVNAKYTSSFNSTINLESDPPVVDKFYIIADPYECHTSSSDETGAFTHFGYYDTTVDSIGGDPMAHLTYVDNLEPGDSVTINTTNPTSYEQRDLLVRQGGFYSLNFPQDASVHIAGSETGSGNTFGSVANWYDLKHNVNLETQSDSTRWVDNRNYNFDTYARRWAFAPLSAVSFINGKWVIDKSAQSGYQIIDPSNFNVPTGATNGFFIAHFTAHWDSLSFVNDPTAFCKRAIKSTQSEHWNRFNVDYSNGEPDDIWFEVQSGTDEDHGHIFSVNDPTLPETINGWTYTSYLTYDKTVYSPGMGGPVIRMHNHNHQQMIQDVALVMTLDNTQTKKPIFKMDTHIPGSQEKTIFQCASLSEAQSGSYVYNFHFDEEQMSLTTANEEFDIYVNGQASLDKIKIWGIYVNWFTFPSEKTPFYTDYQDGLFIPEVNKDEIINLGGTTPDSNNLSSINYNISSLWMRDRQMLSLNWVKRLRSFSIIR